MQPNTWLQLQRSVRFGDTDAAGVMHFSQLLYWCHQAYEESLEHFGLPAAEIFPTPATRPAIALPIVHCSADFHRPLICGDALTVKLAPERLDPGCFDVRYHFERGDQVVAHGLTRHVAIDATSHRRCSLPDGIQRWLEASSLGGGILPI